MRGAEVVWDDYLRIMDAFERFPVDDADIIDAGADKVVSHYRFRISGKGSGAGVEFDYWGVFTIRQGKFGRGQYFVDRAEALAAAGLQE